MGRKRFQKESQEIVLLKQLATIEQAMRLREVSGHPGSFGLPDLLFPRGFAQGQFEPQSPVSIDGWVRKLLDKEETESEYQLRQNACIKAFVEKSLYIIKDANRVNIILIPAMVKFISDIFYRRVSRVVLWKSRGAGGSLCSAITIFLLMVYHKRSVLDVGGSDEQSKVIYSYVKQFWTCFPTMATELLDGEPLASETKLKTGVVLKCVPSSEKQARGKHFSVVYVDEACQADPHTERAMEACVQGTASEKDPIIVMLSTFHLPKGLFQEVWDNAEDKGYTRYNWNVIETMMPCKRGLETATAEDSLALGYCQKCYLTDEKFVTAVGGEKAHKAWGGCCGKARKSSGWETFERVCQMKRMNEGNDIWETEYLNQRPSYKSLIYDPDLIEDAICDEEKFDNAVSFAVGIDWGHESADSMVLTLGVRKLGYVYVAECMCLDHKLIGEIADILTEWQRTLLPNGGKVPIWADRSHPFNNSELSARDFDIRAVDFGTLKSPGIANIIKYLVHRRLKINRKLDMLIQQFKSYRRSETTGKPLKIQDHCCDATLCLMLNWEFEAEFGPDLVIQTQQTQQPNRIVPLFVSNGIMSAKSNPFNFPVPPGYEPKKPQRDSEKDILLF